LTCPNVETASIRAVVTVGVNDLLTSGNETGITKANAGGVFMERKRESEVNK
jgi:hypothetical protein